MSSHVSPGSTTPSPHIGGATPVLLLASLVPLPASLLVSTLAPTSPVLEASPVLDPALVVPAPVLEPVPVPVDVSPSPAVPVEP